MTSLELIKKLVAKGANINARMTKKINFGLTSLNDIGATPFCLAARTADAELMRFFASLGADPKIPTADGATPLIVAAGLGTRSPGEDAGTDSEVVRAIAVAIELGNDPNAVDRNGETAMHGAAYKNVADAVRYLAEPRRESRRVEPAKQTRMDAADDRAGLPFRQLQTVATHSEGAARSHEGAARPDQGI